MINVVATILLIIITTFTIYKLYKEYKQIETVDEEVMFWLWLIIIAIPIIIYYLDRYNILSKYGWFNESNSERWFSFVETYLSSLVSAIIGAVVLIIMTTRQWNLEREKNKEDKRIQNAPIFRYEISNLQIPTEFEHQIINNINGNSYNLFLNVENLGLNHAKKIRFEIFDDIIPKPQVFKFDTQSFLKKDDTKLIKFIFDYKYDSENQKNNNKKIKIIVYYQDLLNNNYYQEINVYVEVTNKSGSEYGGYQLYIVSTEIENEVCKNEDVK